MKRYVISVLAVAAMSAGLAVSAAPTPAQAAVVTCSIDVGPISQGIWSVYAQAKVKCNGAENVFWYTKMYLKTGGEWRDGDYLGNPNMTREREWRVLNSVNWQRHSVTGQLEKCEYAVFSYVYYDIPGSSVRRSKSDSSFANFCN